MWRYSKQTIKKNKALYRVIYCMAFARVYTSNTSETNTHTNKTQSNWQTGNWKMKTLHRLNIEIRGNMFTNIHGSNIFIVKAWECNTPHEPSSFSAPPSLPPPALSVLFSVPIVQNTKYSHVTYHPVRLCYAYLPSFHANHSRESNTNLFLFSPQPIWPQCLQRDTKSNDKHIIHVIANFLLLLQMKWSKV